MFEVEEIQQIYTLLLLYYDYYNCNNKSRLYTFNKLYYRFKLIEKKYDFIKLTDGTYNKLNIFLLEFNYKKRKTRLNNIIVLFYTLNELNLIESISFWRCYEIYYNLKETNKLYQHLEFLD